tara:strand:+ start:113 stop:424 length:312 start_codon:yes stop_codon:yes gene_type:complete
MIQITSKAIHHLKKIASPDILFYCKSGGCNGLEYVLKPIKNPKNADKQEIDSKTNIWICHSSIFYLLGTKIDWLENNMGNRFIFTNPNADGSCGCGKTFNPKI